MAVGLVDKIPSVKFAGLQLGDATKGLVVAGAGDALGLLITRFAPSAALPPVAVKLGVAAAVQWGPIKSFLGKDAANIGSLLLVADAIRSVYDVRGKVAVTLAGAIPAVGGAAVASGARVGSGANMANVVSMSDYYSAAEGRRTA